MGKNVLVFGDGVKHSFGGRVFVAALDFERLFVAG
jgi:hypothetical protein